MRFIKVAPSIYEKESRDGNYYVVFISFDKEFTKENAIFVFNYVLDQILNLEECGVKSKRPRRYPKFEIEKQSGIFDF